MTVFAFCMTPPWGVPKIQNPNGQSIREVNSITGYYDSLKKASGLQVKYPGGPGKHYGAAMPDLE
jgi:hypothetical protein